MDDDYYFEVWQGDQPIAETCATDRERALREALHYAAMYGQDGPVKLYEVKRTEIVLEPTDHD